MHWVPTEIYLHVQLVGMLLKSPSVWQVMDGLYALA